MSDSLSFDEFNKLPKSLIKADAFAQFIKNYWYS